MHKLVVLLALAGGIAPAQELTGRWVVTADYYGTPVNIRLSLQQQGEKLTGTFQGDKLEGSLSGGTVHFVARDDDGNSATVDAKLAGGALTGTMVLADADDPQRPRKHSFTASKVEPRRGGPSRHHEFTPSVFYRQFSPFNKPVLTVAPGDTIHTTTVDAGGADEKSVTRVLGGNPETGPFYIETAAPGDILVVHLNRLKLNRDWAGSDDFLVPRAVDSDLAVKMKDAGKSIRWHLDLARGVATPEKPSEHLKQYSVPLGPMLGCIATAPSLAQAPPPTGDSGRFGGNMDFN